MNIFLAIFSLILDFSWVILAFVSLYFAYKSWRESKHNINLILFFLLVFMIVFAFNAPSSLYLNLQGGGKGSPINPIIYAKIGEKLTIGNVLAHLLILASLQFFFYLKNWKTFYTFPIVATFILFISLYLTPDDIINLLFGLMVFFFILIDGIKSKNGIEIGTSFITWFALSCFSTDNPAESILFAIFRGLSMIFLFLGVSGILDKIFEEFLPDKEKEQKIKNTWITRRVVLKQEHRQQ